MRRVEILVGIQVKLAWKLVCSSEPVYLHTASTAKRSVELYACAAIGSRCGIPPECASDFCCTSVRSRAHIWF